MQRIVFDAETVSAGMVFYELLSSTVLFVLIPIVAYVLANASPKMRPHRKVVRSFSWAFLFLLSCLFIFKCYDRFSNYFDYKACLPYGNGACQENWSKVLEIKGGLRQIFLKTNTFEFWRGISSAHSYAMGREIKSLKEGECLYTVHSPNDVSVVYYAAIVLCDNI